MKIKRSLSIFMMLVITMVLSGCVFTSNADEARQDLLAHAEEKYGQEFVVVKSALGNGFNGQGFQFDYDTLYPKGDDSKVFAIYREKNEEGTGYEYHDGYAYRLAEPLMDERIKGILGNEFSNLKYSSFISNGTLEYTQNEYENTINLDDLLEKEAKNDRCVVTIVATMDCNGNPDKNKISEEAYNFTKKLIDSRIVKNKINIYTYFYVLDDDNFKKVNPWDLAVCNGNELGSKYHVKASAMTNSKDGLNYNDTIQNILKKYDDYSEKGNK